jgi:diadenosine tetraphosphatase ApaH/serine/threonine PP2A family protein phosphatase
MGRQVAILSDIHGNLEALEAVLERLDRLGIKEQVCLGDLVGYGPDPGPCIERARDVFRAIVAGNHDYAAAGLEDLNYFNPIAKQAMQWTMRKLGPEEKDYLGRLPLLRHIESCTLVHSTPRRPRIWDYVMTIDDALRQKDGFQNQICFIGHSHVPFFFEYSPHGHAIPELPHLILEPDRRYLVNVGSVGQPRDGDPRACFCVYDLDEATLRMERVPYPVEIIQEKIIKAGLPSYLAQRLALGA